MMRNSRLRWLIVLLAALSLVAAACGDDDGGGGGGGDAAAEAPTCLDFEAIYSLVGPESTGFANWSDATTLADEVGSDYGAEFPDAPLTVTGPGEESGTFDSFVELVLEGIAEERGIPEEEWAPRPDYTSSPNDNVIIEGIAGSPSSFGWVGYAFFQENQETTRAFEVAGEDGTCVAPTPETIASGEYPISRPLFIYVNTESIENPAVKAYVDFYMGDEGYAATSDAGYVALTEEAWGETQGAWESAGGTPGEPESGVSGDVVVSGSSTVEPISSLVAELFAADNPEVSISVDGPGTGDGFELFCNGETDISDASRAIEEEEIAACEEAGIEYVELQVAIDGLSVLTAA
jgi:ABC-type phosphate transport system substrate-binding protein